MHPAALTSTLSRRLRTTPPFRQQLPKPNNKCGENLDRKRGRNRLAKMKQEGTCKTTRAICSSLSSLTRSGVGRMAPLARL